MPAVNDVETFETFGKTVGRPDPSKEKGFTAVAHCYSDGMAARIARLPALERFVEAVRDVLENPPHAWKPVEVQPDVIVCEVCGDPNHLPSHRGWKELDSCADAVQEISAALELVR